MQDADTSVSCCQESSSEQREEQRQKLESTLWKKAELLLEVSFPVSIRNFHAITDTDRACGGNRRSEGKEMNWLWSCGGRLP